VKSVARGEAPIVYDCGVDQRKRARKALRLALLAGFAAAACTNRDVDEGGRPPGAPPRSREVSARPSVLLISIDTTRADRLGCYGRGGASTPNLDRWAAEGVVFENAVTSVPITLPAHASLMSGLLPHRHGVRDNGIYRVPDETPTLAALLAEAGYDTAAVVGAAVLDRQYGLDRGFKRYEDSVGRMGLAIAERDAAAVTGAAAAAARSLRKPFFLFVHYFDPHAAYDPPPPFAERFRGDLYQGEIAYVDEQIGRLRRELEGLGLLQDTVVVITSDHGESLGEHGEPTHGVFLYQATLRIPLIIVAPERWRGGQRVATLASLIDVPPTLLELTGQRVPGALDGRSLAHAVEGGAPGLRWLPLESEFGYNSYGWAPLSGVSDGALKWIDAPEPELYDLVADPAERRNLVAARPEDGERLAAVRRTLVAEDRRSAPARAASERTESERLARLAALGYTGVGAGPRGPMSGLPDPKRAIGGLESINEARRLMGSRRFAEAERTLQQVIERSPRNLSALVLLGSSRILSGQPGKALGPLERAAALAPFNADVPFNIGLARLSLGDTPGAEKAWRRTLSLAPRYQDAAVNLVDLLMKTGRPEEAERVLGESRRNGLHSALLDYLEGKLALQRGDPAPARVALARALSGSLPGPVAAEARAMLESLPP
jgi:arylsulfatase A-like enzyme/predicted negative regulator of RcsB-dependent stress response